MKKVLLLTLILCILLSPAAYAQKEALLENQDLTPWEEVWETWFPEEELQDFLIDAKDGKTADVGNILRRALERKGGEWLKYLARSAASLTLLVVLEIVMIKLGVEPHKSMGASKLILGASGILYASGLLFPVVQSAMRVLDTLGGFLNGAVSVLLPLLLSSGWNATSGLLQPATLALSAWMDQWLRPLLGQGVGAMMILAMADSLHSEHPLNLIISGGKKLVGWFMGLCMTGFIAVVGIQASAMLGYDSLALRSARYAVDSTLPGVGGFFADMLDTAVVSAQLIRGSLGIASLLVLTVICLEPVIRMGLSIVMLQAAGAFGQVLGESTLSSLFRNVSELLRLMLYGVLISALLVLMIISLACMAGVYG